MSANPSSDPAEQKIRRILDPAHPLSKSDVIWVLEWIKKKVADEDPSLLGLSQPRLLKSFHCFAEAAMFLIHHRLGYDHETNRLRATLAEAVHGISRSTS
ncbi:hypothetical protein [Paenibacillus abyssi]|uniref:Uncharacterized protein n=1 Tax=Paenibacillus abyssi TaxID=1340531 RepID=A0A917D5D2_9BACL|nr:hypothetical protein [Paenibacillus abyssi]GGG09497.1 hypothetical protein GCM10010916_27930 [Paenibacillus abyssi]